MKIKDYLLKMFRLEGVDHVFLVPGGLIDPFLTAFAEEKRVVPMVAAQEGGAAYMADGYARASGKFGVCLCIGGPGATNTVTPLLTAKADGSPLLVISGEVPLFAEGLGMFQDASVGGLNDYEILKCATKYSFAIDSSHFFPTHLRHGLEVMRTPGRGPVHLCIPTDLQETEIDEVPTEPIDPNLYETRVLDVEAAEQCIADLQHLKVAILAGNGVNTAEGAAALLQFSEALDIPVATTLHAKGVFPEDHRLSLGVFGYAGTAQATQALLHEQLEVLIVLGSSLNQRDSMQWDKDLKPLKRCIQVNLNMNTPKAQSTHSQIVHGDAATFLKHLTSKKISPHKARRTWVEAIRRQPRFYDAENLHSNAAPIHPARVIHDLRQVAPRHTTLVLDSGAHRAFCSHYWETYGVGEFLLTTNLGSMGWAIPAAIGAKMAQPKKPCCVVTGDGCMLMHGMEIQTAARYQVPIVYVVMNNAALGNVYLRAKTMGKTPMELTSLPNHDWAAFAKSLGASSETVTDPSQLKGAFERAFHSGAAYLIDVKCGKDFPTPVEPYIAAKKAWSYHD